MCRRHIALVVSVLAVLAVPSASSKSLVLASAKVIGSGTTWTLAIENVSTDGASIKCIRYFAPSGVNITSVDTPAGWASTGAGSNTFGFRQDLPGLAPGQTLSISFVTSAPLTTGGTLHYSPDCVVDVSIEISEVTPTPTPPAPPPPSPPTAPPPPPPPPPPKYGKKCKCVYLDLALDPTLLNKKLRPDKHDFGVGIEWQLKCSKGVGGCTGLLKFQPPAVFVGSIPERHNGLKLNLKSVTLTCTAKCRKVVSGRFQIKMLSREQLNKLFGRTLAYTVVTVCNNQSVRERVRVFVDDKGRLKRP